MSERFKPEITPKSEQGKPYGTLRGFVLKSSAVLGIGGVLAFGYGVNQVRLEEISENREETKVTREFYKANPDPNQGQLFELKEKINSINKRNKSTVISTVGGGTAIALGFNGFLFASFWMAEESTPSDKKRRENRS